MFSSAHRACWLLLLLLTQGCPASRPGTTIRLVDGSPQQTRYISSGSYEHYLNARIAMDRGELQEALRQLRAALILDPKSPYLYTTIATILAQGKLARAHDMLRRALQLDPRFPDALLLQAQIYRRQGQLDAAQRSLRRCIRDSPQHGPAYLELADLLEQAGRSRAATAILGQMVQRVRRDRGQAHRRLATLCLRQLDYACARKHFRLSLSERTDLETLIKLAHVERATGQKAEAIRLLREAFDRSDGNLSIASALLDLLHGKPQQARDLLGVLRTAADDPEQQQELAELALGTNQAAWALTWLQTVERSTPQLQLATAVALHRVGRSSEAEKQLRALRQGPLGPQASLRLADLLRDTGRLHEASQVLQQALTRHGHDTQLVLALSRALHREGRNEPSVQLVRAALDGRPEDRILRFGLAAALERTGDWRGAIREVQQILDRHPKDAPALNFLGYTLADRNQQLDRAERILRRALFLQPGQGYIIDSLGWLEFRRGNWARARILLDMAAHLSPREPEILAHLAEALVALKGLTRAVQLLRRAISVSDDEPLTLRLRRRLEQLERGHVGTR